MKRVATSHTLVRDDTVEPWIWRGEPYIGRGEEQPGQCGYGEFLAECARLLLDAFQHSLEKPETLVPVYAMVNRIRLRASQQVLAEAERLVGRITDQYFSNNLSVQELRQLARSGEADALKAFGEACRVELKSLPARV